MYNFSRQQKIVGGGLVILILLADLIYLNIEIISSRQQLNEIGNRLIDLSVISVTPESASLEEAPVADCFNLEEASQHVGEEACVEGKLDHLYISQKGTIFLNFCPDYQDCSFQAVIFQSDADKFSNLESNEGKTIQVIGLIKTYLGQPEIIINGPTQIKVK